MKNLIRFAMAVVIVCTTIAARADAPPAPYFNGFEKNTNGWFDSTSGWFGTIMRRHSGYTNGGGYADGINSAAGNWHARLAGSPCFGSPTCGPKTNWGGYSSIFPAGGYLTQVDIYLDVDWAMNHPDYRFDWSSTINDNTGNFRRDFVFNVGTELPTQPRHFIIQSSTNAFRSGANPNAPCPNPATPPNSCRPPVIITTSGWYTFRHTFHDDGSGFLAVDFDIFPLGSNVPVMHQTIDSNPYDPMSMVGGNRYGWFANEEIPDLAIDNSLRTGLCHRGGGDADDEDGHGRTGHHHFHKKSTCGDQGDNEDDNVNFDDDQGSHFQSGSVTASTFTIDDNGPMITLVGTGVHDGLPAGFTMIAVNYGDVAPPLFQIVLTDGYTFTGTLVSGWIDIE